MPTLPKTAILLPLVALAGCALPTAQAPVPDPQTYATTDAPIPFAVSRLLPRGVTAQDVRVADNCYGYEYLGQVYPVLIPRGTQYCL
ncbi:hypothetical protein SAMN05444004_10855 [Jannaschia faecimaris]|uniref:Lipoprotein n=1 Tax=Jannaschia faecimaris TaxID=1244108 RepID=A0A1H3RCA3_9RHOB|nr:hypothetical protein [Jannaschia faecimaris]SDZ23260.1 hypothetical protein SAMN05444004_10855 [Jannaschia faecimaris]